MRQIFAIGFAAAVLGAEPVRLIFDTDMGNDIDDALALAMIHAFESRGEAKLLAVTVTKDNRYAGAYCDIVNHFYGRPQIPVGVVRKGVTPKDSNMIRIPVERKRPSGGYVYARTFDHQKAPEAAELIRKTLEGQPDHSVTIVQVGFSTNLACLLGEPGGRDLAARKVRQLVTMAGEFPAGKPEYNVREDLPSAMKVFHEWPTPIVTSGFEIGRVIKFPAVSIERDFGYVADHPIAEAYRHYMKMPYDRETWDLTAVLYAVRPDRGYFGLSGPGRIRVDRQGRTSLEADPAGTHRYLTVDESQKVKTLEALVQLASQPPQHR